MGKCNGSLEWTCHAPRKWMFTSPCSSTQTQGHMSWFNFTFGLSAVRTFGLSAVRTETMQKERDASIHPADSVRQEAVRNSSASPAGP
jgi:hypothetical protein